VQTNNNSLCHLIDSIPNKKVNVDIRIAYQIFLLVKCPDLNGKMHGKNENDHYVY
jgi:hypothetical protein